MFNSVPTHPIEKVINPSNWHQASFPCSPPKADIGNGNIDPVSREFQNPNFHFNFLTARCQKPFIFWSPRINKVAARLTKYTNHECEMLGWTFFDRPAATFQYFSTCPTSVSRLLSVFRIRWFFARIITHHDHGESQGPFYTRVLFSCGARGRTASWPIVYCRFVSMLGTTDRVLRPSGAWRDSYASDTLLACQA